MGCLPVYHDRLGPMTPDDDINFPGQDAGPTRNKERDNAMLEAGDLKILRELEIAAVD